MKNLQKFLFAIPILAILGVTASCQKQEDPKTPEPVATPVPGTMGSLGWDYKKLCDLPSLPEKSGACMANGLLYVIQDSDNPAQVSVFDLSCKLQRTIKINAKNQDWEAIACGGGKLIIGEIGDSGPGNTLLTIDDSATDTVTPIVQTFKYADGKKYNAEGLAYSNEKGLVLATKDWDGNQKLHYISSGYATPVLSLPGMPALGELSFPPSGAYALVTQDESSVFWKCAPDAPCAKLPTVRPLPSGDHEATAFVNEKSFVFMSEDENALYMASEVEIPVGPVPTPAPTAAPVGSWYRPAPMTKFQIMSANDGDYVVKQLRADTEMVNIEAVPGNESSCADGYMKIAAKISALKAKGVKVVCYQSLSYEKWRCDQGSFPASSKGNKMDGWDEIWADWRVTSKAHAFWDNRYVQFAKIGCDAVEDDNEVDPEDNDTGFPLTKADAEAASKRRADYAHSLGMGHMAKNNPTISAEKSRHSDGVFIEEAGKYNERGPYLPWKTAGKFGGMIEYSSGNCKPYAGFTVQYHSGNKYFNGNYKACD